MSIFVDETTKVVYQGLTGSQGRFYGLSFVSQWLAMAVFAGVALMWLVPDRRLERTIVSRVETVGDTAE